MSITTVKGVLWIANLGAVGALGYTLYDWTQTEAEKTAAKATAEIQKTWLDDLPRPEPPKQDIYPYERVEANFFQLNWTGKAPPPPPPPVAQVDPEEQKKPVATPIKDILKVLYLQVDTSAPAYSTALIKYTASALTTRFKEPVNIFEGDALPEPHEGWQVESIGGNGVTFVWTLDGETDPQTAEPATAIDDGNLIVTVGDDGAMVPVRQTFPQAMEGYVPPARRNTVEVRDGYIAVGTEDQAYIAENYLEILSTEVRQRPYRNPRTGSWEGIEILSVAPGSVAAKHGAKTGDVVKSINGNPVNSTQEAIQYVKNNSDMYDVWTVVVENMGKERTITYEEP